MYLCALMYMWVQVPLATRGCRFPGAGLLELNSGPPKSSKHLTTEPSLQLCHLVSWKHFIYPVIFAWLLRLWDIAVRICKFCYSKHYWQSCCLLFVDLSKKKSQTEWRLKCLRRWGLFLILLLELNCSLGSLRMMVINLSVVEQGLYGNTVVCSILRWQWKERKEGKLFKVGFHA